MDFTELNIKLKNYSEEHDLINRAFKSCRVAVKNCLVENPEEGFPLDEIEFRFDKQEFIFDHYFHSAPFVKTQIGLFHMTNGKASEDNLDKFGYYQLDTDEKGNQFDDWLIYKSNR